MVCTNRGGLVYVMRSARAGDSELVIRGYAAAVDAARALRRARQRAGLTQRELAGRTGVAQPTIARIEQGLAVPRVDTLDRLLQACGERLDSLVRGGEGVDRTLIRSMLNRTPAQRLDHVTETARGIRELLDSASPAERR